MQDATQDRAVKRRGKKLDAQSEFLKDYQIEAKTDGLITASFLQKDRIGRQLIPFYRLGGHCLYRLPEIYAAIEANRCGGKRQKGAA